MIKSLTKYLLVAKPKVVVNKNKVIQALLCQAVALLGINLLKHAPVALTT